ncbi:beta-alanine-activating enzyme-like [Saccostrea echinata]|uniref:beta-alanine-activating enzyme-like n=1 Tax=Saccostrea echinata TaxID=191078 RepID=UPI002A832E5D|nr:beta-alanine-activating enzyme-like [Saccostrea echinata]
MSTLIELLERKRTEWLDLVAVIYDDDHSKQYQTYRKLYSFAKKVSDALYMEMVHNSVIAVCRKTDLFTPAILFGIVQSGYAFFNLDKYGVDGTTSLFNRMNVSIVLVQNDYTQVIESLIQRFDGEVATNSFLSSLGLVLLKIQQRNEKQEGIPNIAYCIRTSGSTGQPKLVQVPHSCIIPNITDIRNIYEVKSNDMVFLCSPLTFDPSIVEIFVTLTSGASLLIVPDHVKAQSKKLLSVIFKRNKVTVIQATPSLIQRQPAADVRNSILSATSSLRILALGGEEFPPLSKIREWRAPGNQTQFINLYGITEVSCWSLYHCMEEKEFWYSDEEVPLGKPLSQSSYKILNEEGVEVIEGTGKLYLGGPGRQCIIDDVISDKLQDFRDSGDIVRIDCRGRITFVGRQGRQIKRNGCRLNLREIEKVALADSTVSECKAVFHQGRLIIFVVPHQKTQRIKDQLQSVLGRMLPRHYIPDNIVPVQEIPITKHGKCDFHALLSQCLNNQDKFDDQSSATIEDIVREEWKKLLRGCDLTKDSNFLLSGGDSLSAVMLARSIEDQFELSAPDLVDIILHDTFLDIVNCTEKQRKLFKLKRSTNKGENHPLYQDMTSGNKKRKIDIIGRLWKACCCVNSSVMRGNQYFCKTCMTTVCKLILTTDSKSNLTIDSKSNSTFDNKSNSTIDNKPNKTSTSKPNSTEQVYSTTEKDASRKSYTPEQGISSAERDRTKVKLKQKWSFNTGKCVDASPLVVKSSSGFHEVYIGSHSHNMYALVAETGELLWKTELGDRIESSACISLCGKYIVVGCYDGGVYTLTRDTGNIRWRYKTKSAVKSSPTVDPITGWIFIGSHDHHVHALSIEDQRCCWRVEVGGGSVFSSPAVSTAPYYVCSCSLSGHIAAIQPICGYILWMYNTEKPIFSSPVITDTGPCVGCVDGNLYQLDHQGNLVWIFPTLAPVFSSPLIAPVITSSDVASLSILVGSHDCCVYCLTPDGKQVWKHQTTDFVYSTCFCFGDISNDYKHDNKLLHEGDSGLKISSHTHNQIKSRTLNSTADFNPESMQCRYQYCVVTSKDGNITIIDTNKGQEVNSIKLSWEVFSSPVVVGSLLFVGCRDNNVYCFDIT